MPTHKKGQDRDKYYQLAKDQGFRSRAAFKLIQINKRYSFLSKAKVCIDLCAAPGGWCQVAAKTMAPGSLVLGVDLLPIRPIRGVKTFIGDITTAKCRQDIIAELQGWKADVVLCDGAPNIGSAYSKDAFVQNELVLAALKTASDHLVKGGVFCTKIYRSVDYNALIWVLQQLFEDVQTMKPSSSRSQSSEIFLVCIGFIAPKSIDAKLFDPNHVFKEVADPGLQRPDVLHKKYEDSYKRQRTGYDESLGLLLKATVSVSDFIMSKDPVRMLTDVHEMKFSTEACQQYLEHPRTLEEVKLALSDLRVLGKIDFKKLLKWRLLMRESYHATTKPVKEDKDEEDEDDGLEPEERIMRDIDDMRVKIAQEERKVEKKTRKELRKERVRQQLGMHHNAFDVGSDQELFALDPSLTSVDMARLADVDLDDDNHQDLFEDDENSDAEGQDNDNQRQLVEILDHDLEDELEADYQRLLKIKRSKKQLTLGAEALEEREFRADRTLSNKAHAKKQTVEAKLRKVQEGDEELLDELEEEYSEDEHDSEDEDEEEDSDAMEEDGSDAEEEEEEEVQKPQFMVSKSGAMNAQGKASKWFANPLFSATATTSTSDVSSVLQHQQLQQQQQQAKNNSKATKKTAEQNNAEEAAAAAVENSNDNKVSKKRKAAVLTEAQIDAQFDYMPKTDKTLRKEKRKKATERQERKRVRQLKASAAEEEDEEDEHRIISRARNDEGFAVVPRDVLNDQELTLLDQQNSALVLKKKAATKGVGSKAEMEAAAADFEVVSAGFKMPKHRVRGEDSEDDNDNDDDNSSDDDQGFPRRHDERMYDSDHEDYDRHDRLMTKAIGTMLVSNPAREKALYDSSYNRFAFNDPEGLPSWFMDDEMRHAKPSIPVPQALLDQIKNKYQMTGNNGAKVIKKVAEARMRKKKRAMLQLKKAKKQASLLAENNELSERQKVKLLAKAMRGKGAENDAEKKVYVTTRKTGAGSMAALNKGAKGKLKFVDKRLKKDKRAMKRVEKSKKKGRR